MSSTSAPDLVLLGNLLMDDVVFPDGRTRMAHPGGAMLYAALAARLWGTSVGCVSLRGDDYHAAALTALRERGVALDGVHDLGGDGVRTWLLYEGAVRRVLHRLGCPSHEAVSPGPAHIPEAWRRARGFHLAPMPIAIQRALVEAIRAWESPERPAFVSVDPHLPVTEETLDEWRLLLSRVDAFFPSDDEMRWPAAVSDPARALGSLANGRLRFIAWKRGAAGGALYDARDARVHHWEPDDPQIVDPTGAGDAFAAAFLGAWLDEHPVMEALRRGIASAERASSAWGPDALLLATAGAGTASAVPRPRAPASQRLI
jgi:sugar/nucleoside kinase (ribokinase family)